MNKKSSNNRKRKTQTVSRISKKKEAEAKPVSSKKLVYGAICISLLLVALVVRLAYIQFIQGRRLKRKSQ